MTLDRLAKVAMQEDRQIGITAEGGRVRENAESHSENCCNKSVKGKERHGMTGGERRAREGLLLEKREN